MIYFGKGAMKKTVSSGRTLIDEWKAFGGGDPVATFAGNDRPELINDGEWKACVEKGVTNLFLNSDTLATQDVTVTAVAHTVAIEGAGSITFSGAHTGTLTGVEGERVSVTFTPTAGTLTCTVAGSVTRAQIEVGSYATLYVQSTATQGTRTAPLPVINDALPATGVIYGEVDMVRTDGAQFILFAEGVAGTTQSVFYLQTGGSLITYIFGSSGGQLTVANAFTWEVNTRKTFKFGISYDASNIYMGRQEVGGDVIVNTATHVINNTTLKDVVLGGDSGGSTFSSTYFTHIGKDTSIPTTAQEFETLFEKMP